MQFLRPEDTIHWSHINRLLIEIADHPVLAQNLAFKGGTCASMLGFLDRFSVDLDFDIVSGTDEGVLRTEFRKLFDFLGFRVIRELDKAVFFQIRYSGEPGRRSILKVSANSLKVKANQYKVQYFPEIDRLINSQTLETMVANKLVVVTDRYEQHRTIAGRDIYDIHYFLVHGYGYHAPVIAERTGLAVKDYFQNLIEFINGKVTETIINEDLNTLLPPKHFQQVRKILIPETITLLSRELDRVSTAGG